MATVRRRLAWTRRSRSARRSLDPSSGGGPGASARSVRGLGHGLRNPDRALPVDERSPHLLGVEPGLDEEVEALGGDRRAASATGRSRRCRGSSSGAAPRSGRPRGRGGACGRRRSTSVPPETGSIEPSSRRIWKSMSSRPSSSWRENQSQPTAPAPRALVLHSWSNQASPVTSTSRGGSRPRRPRADPSARGHPRVADVVGRVAGLVALRREAAVAVGDEGLRRCEVEIEREARGRVARGQAHGAAVGVQRLGPPVLEPHGERLTVAPARPPAPRREALGRRVAARPRRP